MRKLDAEDGGLRGEELETRMLDVEAVGAGTEGKEEMGESRPERVDEGEQTRKRDSLLSLTKIAPEGCEKIA